MRVTTKLQLTSPLLTRPNALREALEKVVAETAFGIERGVKERMRAPKHGRTYRRGAITRKATRTTRGLGLRERVVNRGQLSREGLSLEKRLAIVGYRFHRASAPGEAAAVDLASVINSIRTQARGLRASLTANEIAALLEGGTVRMAARPSFGPAFEDARAFYERKTGEAIGGLI